MTSSKNITRHKNRMQIVSPLVIVVAGGRVVVLCGSKGGGGCISCQFFRGLAIFTIMSSYMHNEESV